MVSFLSVGTYASGYSAGSHLVVASFSFSFKKNLTLISWRGIFRLFLTDQCEKGLLYDFWRNL